MDRWYIVRTKAGQEKRAETNLNNQHFCIYNPIIKKATTKQIKEEPLFPGYMFVQLDSDQAEWGKIRSTRGVLDFLRIGGIPGYINDELIMSIVAQCAAINSVADLPVLTKGNIIKIINGPFEGVQGIFLSKSGFERVNILISLANTKTVVKIAQKNLEIVPCVNC